jgi:O-antigen ligase
VRAIALAAMLVATLLPIADRWLIPTVLSPPAWTRFIGEAVLLLVALGVLIDVVRRGALGELLRLPLTRAVGAFVALAVLSALVNLVPPQVALAGLVFTLDGLLLWYAAHVLRPSPRAVAASLGILLGVGAFAAVLAVLQALLTPNVLGLAAVVGRFGENHRLGSILGDPNSMGAFMALLIPLPLVFALRENGWSRRRQALLAVTVLLFLGLTLSFSRGAWLSLGIGIIVGALAFDRRILVAAGLIGAVTLAAALYMPRGLVAEVPTTPISPTPTAAASSAVVSASPAATVSATSQASPSTSPEPSVAPSPGPAAGPFSALPNLLDATFGRLAAIVQGGDLRTQLIARALPTLRDHWLLGVGPGRYGGAAADIFGSPVHEEQDLEELLTHPVGATSIHVQHTVDNFWLHLLLESGLAGTAAFVILLAIVLRPLWAGARRPGPAGALSAAAAIGLIVVASNAFTTMALEANTIALPLWLLLGLAGSRLEGAP